MHRPAIDIYSGDMIDVTRTLLEDLPKIFRTAGRTYIYAANGHGGWEAAVSNVLSRGETILVLESGLFAVGWGEMARMMGVKIEVLKGDWRRAVDPGGRHPAPARGHRARDQGHPGRADRHRLRRRQRHPGDPPGDQRRRASGAVHGGLRGLARLHAVRHGWLGRRRRHGGLAEGPDDAARPGLHGRQRARADRPPEGRSAHALLGLDVPSG